MARTLWLLAGLVAGALVLGLLRLAALPPEHVTHFHANYAVFVDGARLDLSADRFMEDVEKCKANPALMDPPDRVHMHNHDQDVIHVHADAATWGHLFANLRMGLGETWLVTEQGTPLVSSGVKTLKFVLNGELTTEIANRAIRSKDRLLVSYGAETIGDVTRAQFPVVKSNAAEFNEKMDPGSCGARHEETPGERLRRAFWF